MANMARIDMRCCQKMLRGSRPVGIALISFLAGMLFHRHMTRPQIVEAASDHVFELMSITRCRVRCPLLSLSSGMFRYCRPSTV